MLELRILGGLELLPSGGPRRCNLLAQPKRLALLAYLTIAAGRGWTSRETLLGVFWPELDTARARAALRKAVHFLRQELGPEVLESEGSEYLRVAAGVLWCDAAAFRERVAATELEEALSLYRGELLPGLYLSGCPEFEQWVEIERQQLSSHARRAALRLARTAAEAGALERATFWARRAEQVAPQDEEVVRELMHLLVRSGEPSEARRAFDTFAERLRRCWEMEPSPETRELADALGSARAGLPTVGGHPRADATPHDAPPPLAASARLVYRTDASGFLTFANEAAARVAGYAPDEVAGRRSVELVREDYREVVADFYRRQLQDRVARTYYECPVVTRGAGELWLAQKAQLLSRGGRVVGLRIAARDITARRQAERGQQDHSHYDTETGLYNRRACALLLEQKIRLALRNQRGFPLVQVTLGCAADAVPSPVAAAVGEMLRETFRTSDVLARLDSLTFVMIPDEWGPEEAHVLLPRLEVGLASLRLRGLLPDDLEVGLREHRFDPAWPCTADLLLDVASARPRAPALRGATG